jgi:membrane protease YdiL (CAAX protease family)
VIAVPVDVSHDSCYHHTDVHTQLSEFVVLSRPLFAKFTGTFAAHPPNHSGFGRTGRTKRMEPSSVPSASVLPAGGSSAAPFARLHQAEEKATMSDGKSVAKKIVTFVLLTFSISSIFYCVMIRTGSTARVVLGWMWSPGIAAILTQLLFRGRLRDLGWRLGELRYLLLGYVIPLAYASIIYSAAWITGLGGFQPQSPTRLLTFGTLGLLVACLAALGEEVGWRGLLVPELAKATSFGKAVILTGIIWAIWHYPAIIFADYRSEAPLWFQLSLITLAVLGYSVLTAWLRLRTGSIWPTVLWHGAHNLFIQQIFLDMTVDTGMTEYFVDDFGVGVVLSSLVLGYIFWRKRSELRAGSLLIKKAA